MTAQQLSKFPEPTWQDRGAFCPDSAISFRVPARRVHTVFIHSSDSNRPTQDRIEVMWNRHVLEGGMTDVGYHYFIRTDGTIELGRSLRRSPAAQARLNAGTIAICVHGREAADFERVQFTALFRLCTAIKTAYRGTIRFRGHCEVSTRTCPVFDYAAVLGLSAEGFMGGSVARSASG